MKVKTMQFIDIKILEDTINEFNKDHIVKATQTHITVFQDKIIYTAILYYEV